MTNYWEPTAHLLHRPEDTFTADEQASVACLLAFFEEMDGVGPLTEDHLWCRNARDVEVFARRLQRLPIARDDAPETLLSWLNVQQSADLNSFQRARLEAIPGWSG
ncbi:hypothetical protein [Microbacterium sp. TPU 3598]|uniref:hypothetical protein n=1 Tax=Microbacterium sp. TPU 3598 TaxID=1938334 RepID=UPI001E2DBFBF|nr:hypothetical protein [Microbacterium sp. TPU 3598]